jgi:hypothetical protein
LLVKSALRKKCSTGVFSTKDDKRSVPSNWTITRLKALAKAAPMIKIKIAAKSRGKKLETVAKVWVATTSRLDWVVVKNAVSIDTPLDYKYTGTSVLPLYYTQVFGNNAKFSD